MPGTDQARVIADAQAQLGILPFQPRRLQRPFDNEEQPVGIEGLFDEIIGAALNRRHGGLDRAMAGDHHHWHARHLLVQRLQYADAIQLGALQPHIEDDEIRAAQTVGGQRLIGRAGAAGLIPFILENGLDQHADIRLVIHDQNFGHQAGNSFASSIIAVSGKAGKTSDTSAPTPPGAAFSTRRPPWSSMILATIASPSPVPFGLCVT